MNAKEYLNQAFRIDERINSKIEQARSLRALAEKATSVISKTPPNGARNVSRVEDVIIKMADLEAEINADAESLVDLKRDIVSVIKKIENPEYQTLLELRYLCFKAWEQIAVDMHRSIQHIYRLHEAALKALEKILKLRVNVIE
jgi:hypothetical protein